MPNQYTSMPSRIEQVTCAVCGKVFPAEMRRKRKYCSDRCKGYGSVGHIRRAGGEGQAVPCEQCGKDVWRTPSQPRRFCNSACFGRWLAVHNVGPANPTTGRRSTRPKPMTTLVCPACKNPFEVAAGRSKHRTCCSRHCAAEWRARRGSASPFWRGGYTPQYGPSWPAARRAVRRRDQICRHCGKYPQQDGPALDVHHLRPFRCFGLSRHLEANALTNLIALCHSCHRKAETLYRQSELRSCEN